MLYTNIIKKLVNKIIPQKRRRDLFNTPALYKFIKVLVINIFLIGTPLILVLLINQIKETYYFPETIYWILLPLLFISFPFILLLYNLICYLIPPFRKYLNEVHAKNNLPNFSDASKGIIKGLLYISPLLLVVLLGLFLSYKEYSNIIIAPSVILTTLGIVIIMGKRLLKSLSVKTN